VTIFKKIVVFAENDYRIVKTCTYGKIVFFIANTYRLCAILVILFTYEL